MTRVTLIPGDGIGPEISESVREIFTAAQADIQWDVCEAGLPHFEKTGKLISDELVASLNENKIALKGPTTTPSGSGHRSINVTMRQQFNLFANVRPVKSYKGIKCYHDDVDFLIVRENSEDLYKGIEYQISNDVAHGIKLITRQASERIGRFACELAQKEGRKRVTIVHKANIMKLTDGLFLNSIQDVASDYPDIIVDDILVDNACMQLVKNPSQFDVLVTENLYGDIVSDLGSGLIGGLGLACGANIGEEMAIFEAVHGSAPDIAGQNKANPTALLMSGVNLLTHIGQGDVAQRIRNAAEDCLGNPETCTGDIGGSLGTTEFTRSVISNL